MHDPYSSQLLTARAEDAATHLLHDQPQRARLRELRDDHREHLFEEKRHAPLQGGGLEGAALGEERNSAAQLRIIPELLLARADAPDLEEDAV